MNGIFGNRRFLLAPLAGITDSVFREICREHGADLTFTEMVSAKGLSYSSKKTQSLIELGADEQEVSVQLFGHEPDSMAAQAAWVEDQLGDKLVSIDINMGCPVRKIVSKGDGAALMKAPSLAAEIIRETKRATSVPITAKFRRSWDATGEHVSAAEFAHILEDAGVEAVTVHGRYATQMYRGKSDRDCIRETVKRVSIPVVGNGDLFSAEDGLALVNYTGCSAVMIARGALGNPWIFNELHASFDGDVKEVSPSIEDKLNMLRRHLSDLDVQNRGHLAPMRRIAMYYVAGMPGAARARGAFSSASSLEQFLNIVDTLHSEVENATRSL